MGIVAGGFALGFELNEGLFDRPEVPGDSRMVVRVVYRSEFEMLYWEDEIDPIPEESRKFELLILRYNTKSAQWEHEHEYREFVDLLGCTLSAGLYFSNFGLALYAKLFSENDARWSRALCRP